MCVTLVQTLSCFRLAAVARWRLASSLWCHPAGDTAMRNAQDNVRPACQNCSRVRRSRPARVYLLVRPQNQRGTRTTFLLICRFGIRRRLLRPKIRRPASAIKRSEMFCTTNLRARHSAVSAVCLWAAGLDPVKSCRCRRGIMCCPTARQAEDGPVRGRQASIAPSWRHEGAGRWKKCAMAESKERMTAMNAGVRGTVPILDLHQ